MLYGLYLIDLPSRPTFCQLGVLGELKKLAQLYVKEIVRLHGSHLDIVLARDQRFQAHFWQALQKAFGTNWALVALIILRLTG